MCVSSMIQILILRSIFIAVYACLKWKRALWVALVRIFLQKKSNENWKRILDIYYFYAFWVDRLKLWKIQLISFALFYSEKSSIMLKNCEYALVSNKNLVHEYCYENKK